MDNALLELIEDIDSLTDTLNQALPDEDAELWKDKISLFCSDIARGNQRTIKTPKIDLKGREHLWLYKLAEQIVDSEDVFRTPEQRLTEIGHRVIDLSFWLGVSKGYDLSELLYNPTESRQRRFWRDR